MAPTRSQPLLTAIPCVQDIHKALEVKIAAFHGMEDAILYASCFDANAGLFEVLLGEKDAVFSDQLNHASIIDGIRLAKTRKFRYKHNGVCMLRGLSVDGVVGRGSCICA